MHGTQADVRLLGEFALRDVGVFMDQVHDPKVGIGMLCLAFGVHLFKFSTLPPCRVILQHEYFIKLWLLFNIEHQYCKLKSVDKQGGNGRYES